MHIKDYLSKLFGLTLTQHSVQTLSFNEDINAEQLQGVCNNSKVLWQDPWRGSIDGNDVYYLYIPQEDMYISINPTTKLLTFGSI